MRAFRSQFLSRAAMITNSVVLLAAVVFLGLVAVAYAGGSVFTSTDLSAASSFASGSTSFRSSPAVAPGMFAVQTFGPGSLIIPMDTGASGQDNGMLRAYGLVYELLRHGIPVNWVINPAKSANGDDFSISLTNALQDVRTGATLSPRTYRGGPFIIDAADAAAALPVIAAWQSTVGDQTAVHRITSGSVMQDVARRLVSAPRIAVLKDGNETIAFNNLNAAGIRDSQGSAWTAASPDLLTEAGVAGTSTLSHNDGILFHQSNGLPRYSYLAAMHYNTTAQTPEVVQEMRSWLDAGSLTHAFMLCEAARVVENSGFFLTTAGIVDDGSSTTTPTNRVPSHPLTQMDGAFEADSGAMDSFRNDGGIYKTGVQTLINESSAPFTQRIVELTGRLDGDNSNGRVTYLAGHDYSTVLPVSTNPQTNGVRLMLNTLFNTDSATTAPADTLTVTQSAPALTNASTIPYTINYSAAGTRPAENIRITDTLPAGTTYLAGSATVAPTSISGNVITWDLPPLAPGGSASITYSVSVTADGSYTNRAAASYSTLTVATANSAPVATVRDTVPPTITITGGPSGPTNNATPSFTFTTVGSPVATFCRIDGGGPVACAASFTSPVALVDGVHTFTVTATDAAGNAGMTTITFTVDTHAPTVAIDGPPINPDVTNSHSPRFFFTVDPDATAVTTFCSVAGDPFVACLSPFTTRTLIDGTYQLSVYARDAAGNVGPTATRSFIIDSVPPTVTITGGPTGTTNNATPTFTFVTGGSPVTTFCRIDSGGPVPCATSFTPPIPLANGTHTFTVTATDAAGNAASATRTFTINVVSLVSIQVTPTNPSVPAGRTVQFSAFGTYSDGTTQDLTNSVTWSSSSPAIAQISNAVGSKGLATGLQAGMTVIRAIFGSVAGSTQLTVTSPILVSISVTPVNPNILVGATIQFTATGAYSDGTLRDLTTAVTWSSTILTVARISNAVGSQGVATGLVAGTAQITARLGSLSASTTLTVSTLRASKQGILAELNTALSTATSNKDKNNLKDAIKKLDKSLDSSLWATDGNHLACDHGNKVFGREKSAVKSLMAMIGDTSASNITDATIQRWIIVLVAVDRGLAQIAVSEASVSAQVRSAALEQIAGGDEDAANGDFDKAITHYKRAWKKVRSCGGDDDDEDDDDHCGRHDH